MSEIKIMFNRAGLFGVAEQISSTCEIFACRPMQFTAEKQIELIKWLCIKDEFNCYQNKVTKEWIIFDHEKDCTHITSFDECLASWINYIWQDLTLKEKLEIMEILKG